MALLDDDPELDLYDKEWVIHTRSEERAPAKVGPTAQVHRSLISHGCVIDGHGRQLASSRRASGWTSARSSATRSSCSTRSSARARSSTGRSSTRRSSSARARSSATGPTSTTAEQAGAGPPQHRHHGRRQAVGHPARRPDRAQRQGRRATSAPSDFAGRGRAQRRVGRAGLRPASRGARPTPHRRPRTSRPAAPSARRAAEAARARTSRQRRAPTGSAGRCRRSRLDSAAMSSAARASRRVRPADVEAWLAELGLAPAERAEREGSPAGTSSSTDAAAFDLRVTLILDPALALICWAHYAPPISDMLPQVVPQAPALERRVPVRQVLGRRGRAAAARRRAPDRRGGPRRAGPRARPPARRRRPVPRRDRRVAQGRRLEHRTRRRPRRRDGPGVAPCRPLRRRARGAARALPTRAPADGTRPGPAGRALAIAVLGGAGRARSAAPSLPAITGRRRREAAATDLTLVTDAHYTVRPRTGASDRRRWRSSRHEPHARDQDPPVLLRPRVPRRPARDDRLPAQRRRRAPRSAWSKRAEDYTLLRLDFGKRLYSGDRRTLPAHLRPAWAPGKGANPQIRVGTGLVTFPSGRIASNGASGQHRHASPSRRAGR